MQSCIFLRTYTKEDVSCACKRSRSKGRTDVLGASGNHSKHIDQAISEGQVGKAKALPVKDQEQQLTWNILLWCAEENCKVKTKYIGKSLFMYIN